MVDFHAQQLRNRPVSVGDAATYSEIARWIGFAALLVGLLLAYAWLHLEILNISYEVEKVKRENTQLRELNAALRAERTALLNPEKIDQQAQQLGMIRPHQAGVLILQAETTGTAEEAASNLIAAAQEKALLE